ncbi:prolyl endopeptidase isoform X2 [Frankliniella occidentalis]|uniref:Prolyl endopeptidase n=1 Tax=Frankliniella occidentalis TaxID=133901 RepID=A0A6J1S0Z8_FRAOC|nr:prolyl endopeptidase isoform X2 [Frankliniella occidentalis]
MGFLGRCSFHLRSSRLHQLLPVKLRLEQGLSFQRCRLLVDRVHFASSSSNLVDVKMKQEYPAARRDETVVEEFFGVKVADPYRWMEDPDAEETKAFVDAQNAISRPFIDSCPVRKDLHSQLTKLWDFPKYTCPHKKGNRYHFRMNTGLQNQSVLYNQDTLDSEPRVFLDPNLLSDDGTVALSLSKFTENGEKFAYGLSHSGSDWNTVHFKDVETGDDYPEKLEKVKYSSLAWSPDNNGIFYGCYPDQNGRFDGCETEGSINHKLYYHKLGTPQSEDILVVEFPKEPLWRIGAELSDCQRYLIVTTMKDCRDNMVFICDLEALPGGQITEKLPLIQIVHELDSDYDYVTNEGKDFIFHTNKGAPNYRLIKINIDDPGKDKWETLVQEDKKDVLSWAVCVAQNKLVLCYIQDVKSVLQLHDLGSGEHLNTFPLDVGSIVGFSGQKDQTEIFYQFTSFLTPGVIYHVDLTQSTIEPKVFREIKVGNIDLNQFETTQVFYNSKDGTKVPMFIVHKKGLVKDGKNPCLVYGYGGFNISLQPTFSVTRLIFIRHLGGILAIPNLRGGGEYGENWHNGGRLLNKQNTFDDMASAAEYLIDQKYTCRDKLAIQGGSSGGMTVGACANQRPELFGAVICQAGVMDMLRFHKFTIGYCWVSDYGSPDEKEHFFNLKSISPLHNIKVPERNDVQYPAVLVFTADHDDRVVPLHSLKYIAELQHTIGKSDKQTNPLQIYIDTKSGHGHGKPTAKVIDECADILSFLWKTLNLTYFK